jgi:phosphinothricin acetyltransferase
MAGGGGIRIAASGDAAAVQAIYAPYVAETVISFEIEPPSVAEMARRIAMIGARFPWLVYGVGDEIAGYAYAGPHKERAAYQWAADATVYVAAQARGKGVGRALYRRLLAILDFQGFHTVFGGITLPNAASVGLHEACGFRPVGVYREVGYKFGAWRDVGWWGLRLSDAEADPRPPQAFSRDLFDRSAAAERLARPVGQGEA